MASMTTPVRNKPTFGTDLTNSVPRTKSVKKKSSLKRSFAVPNVTFSVLKTTPAVLGTSLLIEDTNNNILKSAKQVKVVEVVTESTTKTPSHRQATPSTKPNKSGDDHSLITYSPQISSDNSKNEYKVQFSSGPMGMKLEPVMKTVMGRELGCRVVDFVNDTSSSNTNNVTEFLIKQSQALMTNKISVGDIITAVNSQSTLAKDYVEIIKLLRQSSTSGGRVITFRSLKNGEKAQDIVQSQMLEDDNAETQTDFNKDLDICLLSPSHVRKFVGSKMIRDKMFSLAGASMPVATSIVTSAAHMATKAVSTKVGEKLVGHTSKDFQQLVKLKQDLLGELSQARIALAKESQERSNKSNELEDLRSKQAVVRRKLLKTEENLMKTKSHLDATKAKVKTYKEIQENMEVELKDHLKEISSLKLSLEDQRRSLDQATRENVNLRKNLRQSNEDNEALQTKLNDALERKGELESELNEIKESEKKLQSNILELEAEVDNMRKHFEQAREVEQDELQKIYNRVREALGSHNDESQNYTTEVLRESINTLILQLSALDIDKEATYLELQRAQEETKKLNDRLTASQDAFTGKEIEITKLNFEINSLSALKTSLQEKLSEMKEANECLEENVKNEKEKLLQKEDENSVLDEKVRQMAWSMKKLKEKLNAAKENECCLLKKVEGLVDKDEENTQSLKRYKLQNSELTKVIQDKTDQIKVLQSELERDHSQTVFTEARDDEVSCQWRGDGDKPCRDAAEVTRWAEQQQNNKHQICQLKHLSALMNKGFSKSLRAVDTLVYELEERNNNLAFCETVDDRISSTNNDNNTTRIMEADRRAYEALDLLEQREKEIASLQREQKLKRKEQALQAIFGLLEKKRALGKMNAFQNWKIRSEILMRYTPRLSKPHDDDVAEMGRQLDFTRQKIVELKTLLAKRGINISLDSNDGRSIIMKQDDPHKINTVKRKNYK